MSRLLKLASLPKFGEIGRERLKRGLLLLAGCGIILGGARLLASKKIVSSQSFPVSQEELVNLGEKVLDKALNVLGRKVQEGGNGGDIGGGEEEANRETVGEVAGVVQEVTNQTQVVIEKTVEKKVEEIIEMIKELPEEQAEKIKKEVMKGICEEVCRIE